ncbi:hypothetical protein [Shewanella sp. UCD-KL12]|uniref:hypothetical protein n=1 Tax=Shewanella sp. UCD-KL12 TaxID=1917163 RepID=UPI0009714D53|nr:hypothetical protein [Shewanella sp. UCD-KL12]
MSKRDSISLSESLLINNNQAMQLHSLGMTPKCIDEFVAGTYNNVRRFKNVNPQLQFSRGSSAAWTFKKSGFKFSNILFKLYINVSGDLSLSKEPKVSDIVATWTAAQILYPEIITDQICDITRFSYLIRGIIDHSYIVESCSNKKCKSQFIRHYSFLKKECWCCIEKREVVRITKVGCAKPTSVPTCSPSKKAVSLAASNNHVDISKHFPHSISSK